MIKKTFLRRLSLCLLLLNLCTEYCRLLNVSRENTDDENSRKDMVYMCFKYNAKVRQCKSDYDKQFTYKLKNSMASNSNEFWKLLRPQKQNNNSVISADDFLNILGSSLIQTM